VEINSIISLSVPALTTVVMIVAVETIGTVQFLKNFFHPEKKRTYAVMSLLVVVACSWMNTPNVPGGWTAAFDIAFLALAVTQLAWDVVVKGVPNIVARAMKMEGGNDRTK
jgi:hypothetical protein